MHTCRTFVTLNLTMERTSSACRADDPVQLIAVRVQGGNGTPRQTGDLGQIGLLAERHRHSALADGSEDLRRHFERRASRARLGSRRMAC
jgi:hypothetical protein